MRRVREAGRLQDSIVVALAVVVLGFAVTSSRADRDGVWGEVTLVQAPPAACGNVDPTYRNRCLEAAAALALRY